MDSFAVTLAASDDQLRKPWWLIPRNVLFFALFQGGMPLLGHGAGSLFSEFWQQWDHWVSFILLGAIGTHMLMESAGPPSHQSAKLRSLQVTLLLAFATSIDAFAAGVTLASLGPPIWLSIVLIGLTTAIFCGVAFFLGTQLRAHVRLPFTAIGGFLLIGLGGHILLTHLGWIAF